MAETLQLIITADNREALKAIEDLAKSTQGLQTQFKKVGSASNEANQALINSGRVLQDLNYGFMGIANNINPLLESYQRLGDKTKEGSSASEELKKALMGPAGLGVAVSALIFIFLKFGDAITTYIEKIALGRNAVREEMNAIEGAADGYKKAYLEVAKLKEAFQEFHDGTMSKKQVLEQYNSTLGKVYGSTNDINKAEKTFTENTDNYIQAAYLRAAADIELLKAAQEAAKAAEAKAKPKEQFTPMFQVGGFGAGATSTSGLKAQQESNRKDVIAEINIQKKFYEDIANDLLAQRKKLLKPYVPEPEAEKDNQYTRYINMQISIMKDELSRLKRFRDSVKDILGKTEIIPLFSDKEASVTGKKKTDMKSEYDRILKGDNTLGTYLEKLTKDLMPDINIEKLLFRESVDGWKKSKDAAKDFANTMANDITGALRSTWDAIQGGKSVFDAISESLMRFIEELGFAIIKAQILADIQNSIKTSSTGVTGADAGGTGFFDLLFTLMKVVPFANGGIVNKPTFSMIGEAGPEAVMPLSKLSGMMSSTFNAGAMSGATTGNSGQFVLRGQDLLVAINRTQKSSFLKGQNISLV